MYYLIQRSMIAVVVGLVSVTVSAQAAEESAVPLVEGDLIAILQAEGDYMTHLAAFRGLRQVGTEAAVPVVATFLHDEKKSHLARYVLEGMASDDASKVLRESLAEAPVAVLPGILSSLGARRDGEAAALILPLTGHENPDVARHAKAALGRIATPEAANALLESYDGGTDIDLAEALLAAAQNLVADGDHTTAAPIYRALRSEGNPEFVRIGAFYGLIGAEPAKAPERVIATIQGTDPLYRKLAREVVAETKGKAATLQYAEALSSLPNEVQVQMLAGLARRGDKSARDGVVTVAESKDPAVRRAAIDALGTLGNAKDVQQLAMLMKDSDEGIATAARNSLIRLRGDRVDQSIVIWMKKAGSDMRARLLNILDVRLSPSALPQARLYLKDNADAVRLASLGVFLQLGELEDFDAILSVLRNATNDSEKDLASRGVAAIAKRNSGESLPLILDALAEADAPVKLALVDALGDIGGEAGLTATTGLLEDESPAVKKKVLSVLSAWPTQDASDILLKLANSEDPDLHDAGLKGYTRLAQTHPEHDPKNAMMATAMSLARSKEEKWMVLSAYGNVHTGPALDALEAQLEDPEVQKEAAMALLKVNEAVTKHGEGAHPRVRKSLELLKSKVATEYVQKKADELLSKLTQ